MKKYILFFISIGLLLGIVLFYNVMNVEKSKEVSFSEAGYILKNSSDRYYFYQDEKYTKSYDNQIVFLDTEGSKVTLGNDNFIHYESGNIVALQEGVLLDLSKIDDDPIIYYNISANKEIKKLSNRYTIKNLDEEIQIQNAIWKIAQNKYMIISDNITIKLNNGTENKIEGYIEIEYSDNEIVSIYNQEISYQTISSDSYIELPDSIKINLGTKIVSKKDENKMSLEDMVINSDDNVTLIDLNVEEEKENNEENETENEVNNETNGTVVNNSNNNSTTNSNSQSSIINQGTGSGTGNIGGNNEDSNTIDILTPDIKYEDTESGETEVDMSESVLQPKFKVEDFETTAIGVTGKIKITDESDLLSKDHGINIKIINNNTGKTVYNENEAYGTLNIPIQIQSLVPENTYTLIVQAAYSAGGNIYTKNFVYKTFVTSNIGIEINKNGFTDEELKFAIGFTDKKISTARATLLYENGTEVGELYKRNVDNIDNATQEIEFINLKPNTKYKLMISDIQYSGATQTGEQWVLYYSDAQTLKSKAEIQNLNYYIDIKNGNFDLLIEDVKDDDQSIESYTYLMYEYMPITGEDGIDRLEPSDEVCYKKETKDKKISVPVGSSEKGDAIVRNKYYGFKVIANCYDNEKYMEIESAMCGAFSLKGKSFPTVRMIKNNVTANSIDGTIKIFDADRSIVIDANNPLIIRTENSIGEEETLATITSKLAIKYNEDEGAYNYPVFLEGLRADTSYTFSVYATVELDLNNIYQKAFIGSSIVTTNKYKDLTGTFIPKENPKKAFEIEFSLSGEEFEKQNLNSITFQMQAGANIDYTQPYDTITINSENYSVFVKDGTKVSSLKELLCSIDNPLVLTPNMIGGENQKYNQSSYTVVATITIDGTEYKNKIPIVPNTNYDNIKSIEYTEDNETYKGIAINVKGGDTTAPEPEDKNDAIIVEPIQNRYAKDYNIEDTELNSDTIVGYKIKAKGTQEGTKKMKRVTYYAWAVDGTEIKDESGNQLTFSEDMTNKTELPYTVIELERGTKDDITTDNETGKLYRGGAYYFTYTITYEKDDGSEELWPKDFPSENGEIRDHKTYKSKIQYPKKQQPNIVMYPKTSNENSITYIIKCYDFDKALENYTTNSEAQLNMYEVKGETIELKLNKSINTMGTTTNENGEEGVTFGSDTKALEPNSLYLIRGSYKLNKVNGESTVKDLVKQRFDGVINLSGLKYTVSYDNGTNPNKIIITFDKQSNVKFSRVAGAKVNLVTEGTEVTTDFNNEIFGIKYNEDVGQYYIEVDLLKLGNDANKFVDKSVDVKVQLCYDNGKIGFLPGEYTGTEDIRYAAYVNTTTDNYSYMFMDDGGNLSNEPYNSIVGNIFEYEFNTPIESEWAELQLTNLNGRNNTYQLKYTDKGLMYGDNIIVQKEIATEYIDSRNKHPIIIDAIVAGIKVNKIIENITEVQIEAQITNPGNILSIDTIAVEIYQLDTEDEKIDGREPNRTEPLSVGQMAGFNITGLMPAKYYKIKFKYHIKGQTNNTYTYMYDTEELILGKEYKFSTLASIDIKNIGVTYEAKKYTEKYLNISYNINKETSNQYYKTKYELFKYNSNAEDKCGDKIEFIEGNIAGKDNTIYSIDNEGSLYVQNTKYNKDEQTQQIIENINISPNNHILDFNNNYVLVITPIVKYIEGGQEKEQDIQIGKLTFELKKLAEPKIGVVAVRDENTYGTINLSLTLTDSDQIIFGDEENGWGEYRIEIYENENKHDVEGITDTIFTTDTPHRTFINRINNLDFTNDYRIKIIYNVDMNNDNILEEKTVEEIIRHLDTSEGINIGTMRAVENNNKVDLLFYNSFNIAQINYVEYAILKASGQNILDENEKNFTIGNGEKAEWFNVTNDNGTSYYKLTLPKEITLTGTYTIRVDLYKQVDGQKTLVKAIETVYEYKQ